MVRHSFGGEYVSVPHRTLPGTGNPQPLWAAISLFFLNCLLICTRSTRTFVILSTALLSLYPCCPSPLSSPCLLTFHVITMPVSSNLLYATVNLLRAAAACVPEDKSFLGLSCRLFMEKRSFHIVPLHSAPVFDLQIKLG